MITKEFLKETIQSLKDQNAHTFAELISALYTDKFIEIYVGDTYEEVSTDQISQQTPAVFFGKVISSFNDCLIINSVFLNHDTKKYQLGNLMFINDRSIRTISELDGTGLLNDMFHTSAESYNLKKIVENK